MFALGPTNQQLMVVEEHRNMLVINSLNIQRVFFESKTLFTMKFFFSFKTKKSSVYMIFNQIYLIILNYRQLYHF